MSAPLGSAKVGSVGEAERERAYKAMTERFYRKGPPKRAYYASWPTSEDLMRFAFDAGVEHGQELRGYCQEAVEMDGDSDVRKLLERHPLP